MGELYGVTSFAFRSVKFPACLNKGMLCVLQRFGTKSCVQHHVWGHK